VTRWTFHGTNTGDFETPAPLPATGKKVAFTGTNIYRFAGGKIVEEWFLEDTMGLLRQLGFMPAEE
jgi:predicted ester cyclase